MLIIILLELAFRFKSTSGQIEVSISYTFSTWCPPAQPEQSIDWTELNWKHTERFGTLMPSAGCSFKRTALKSQDIHLHGDPQYVLTWKCSLFTHGNICKMFSCLRIHSFINSFIINHLSFEGSQGGWSQSQLTLGEGEIHPGQVASSLQGWHKERNNHSRSH